MPAGWTDSAFPDEGTLEVGCKCRVSTRVLLALATLVEAVDDKKLDERREAPRMQAPERMVRHGDGQGEQAAGGQTPIHRRLPNRNYVLRVSAGWHMHLDVLVARASGGKEPDPFWEALNFAPEAPRTEAERLTLDTYVASLLARLR